MILISKRSLVRFKKALVTIYWIFIKPHLKCSGIIYDKPNNKAFIDKIEKGQHDTALAITSEMKGTSQENLYAEISLESLKFMRWFMKLDGFYKIQLTGLHLSIYFNLFLLIVFPTI